MLVFTLFLDRLLVTDKKVGALQINLFLLSLAIERQTSLFCCCLFVLVFLFARCVCVCFCFHSFIQSMSVLFFGAVLLSPTSLYIMCCFSMAFYLILQQTQSARHIYVRPFVSTMDFLCSRFFCFCGGFYGIARSLLHSELTRLAFSR